MIASRAPSWLPLTGLLALVTLGLIALMVGFAGDQTGRQALGAGAGAGAVEILRDNAGRETAGPEEIAALPAEAWRPMGAPGFANGAAPQVVWMRVTLTNPGAAPLAGVLADVEHYTDRTDLYVRGPGGSAGADGANGANGAWRHLRSGEWTPSRAKALRGREAAFPLVVPAGGEVTVLLRHEDRIAVWLELAWWPEAGDFHAAVQRGLVAESAYFGMLLALLLYNLVLWLRVRFPGTGAYLLYLGNFMGFMFVARQGPGLLGAPLGSPWLETGTAFTLALSAAFLAEFSRQVLELPERLPRADRVARGARWLMFALAAAVPVLAAGGVVEVFHFILLGVMVTHVALFGVAVAAWRAGARSARYYLPACGFLLAGLLPLLGTWLPALSVEATSRLVMVGTLLEMLLLSVAIADRFAGLQREKIEAQAQAMTEADQRQVLQEAYADELEHEVSVRTGELVAANADKDRMMAVLGHDLRSPLAALTRSAEQLAGETKAAGERDEFIAEAARSGRALLGVLEDVVLWARLRAGTGKAADHGALEIVAPAAELHRALAVQRGVTLAVAAGPAASDAEAQVRVRVDAVLAQTLVRNLVSNAVKSARSRVDVTVAAAATEAAGADARVRVSVRDDGPGLPVEVSEALRPGARAVGVAWPARSGLGLRLCAEIAQALGTRLEVAEPGGGGTEISFTLPRAES